ncbi:hypothetical protein EYZ11_009249 [Aspergillus tanneri]|uniref:Uncharacterized protein n=1 Tax=Aspergillus tanneri TaxID=1220188 RepID=A0A4S3J8E5_9EURO|nr:hypothetical protein EYZ11_009249 [Aspergillus tanneri]
MKLELKDTKLAFGLPASPGSMHNASSYSLVQTQPSESSRASTQVPRAGVMSAISNAPDNPLGGVWIPFGAHGQVSFLSVPDVRPLSRKRQLVDETDTYFNFDEDATVLSMLDFSLSDGSTTDRRHGTATTATGRHMARSDQWDLDYN